MTEPKINLRGMIRLDEVEDLLTQVLQRLDSQDKALASLTSAVATLMPLKAAQETYAELKNGIEILARDISAVREDILVQIDGRSVPVSVAVSGHDTDIKKLQQHVPLLIERAEVQLHLQTSNAAWREAVGQTRQWAAPNDLVSKLQAAHTETVRRLNGVEQLTSCKLDRSEVAYLEGLANNFESFGKFQKEVLASIDVIDHLTKTHTSDIADNKSLADALKRTTDSLCLKLTTLTPKAETRAIAKELEKQHLIMKRLCDIETVHNLSSQVLSSSDRLSRAEEHLHHLQATVDGVSATLPTKADAKDLSQFVTHSRINDIDEQLKLKGEAEIIIRNKEITEEKFQKMDLEYTDLSARLAVALRFVEWFTHRGETYEHNMKIIDKHLHGLATTSSDPKNRQIFDSAIRYTPMSAASADKRTAPLAKR